MDPFSSCEVSETKTAFPVCHVKKMLPVCINPNGRWNFRPQVPSVLQAFAIGCRKWTHPPSPPDAAGCQWGSQLSMKRKNNEKTLETTHPSNCQNLLRLVRLTVLII